MSNMICWHYSVSNQANLMLICRKRLYVRIPTIFKYIFQIPYSCRDNDPKIYFKSCITITYGLRTFCGRKGKREGTFIVPNLSGNCFSSLITVSVSRAERLLVQNVSSVLYCNVIACFLNPEIICFVCFMCTYHIRQSIIIIIIGTFKIHGIVEHKLRLAIIHELIYIRLGE